MLNKLSAFLKEYEMVSPGELVVCAVSGGMDSVSLLFALHLLQDTMDFQLEAAHFNHHLRGKESQRDADFVKDFCKHYAIPLHMGGGTIVPGPKGLEAAAREARYAFFDTLPGKIATAHTADDNTETILMHLVRGTGLKGLGGIMPVNGRVIRPLLTCTRAEVEAFSREYSLPHVEDSSNRGDDFLRNRLRHGVMPLLKAENPRLCENISAMALGLRQEEEYLAGVTSGPMPGVEELRSLHPAIRRRWLEKFLKKSGVREPEEIHLIAAEKLVFSPKPSARGNFPGGVIIGRNYDRLEKIDSFPKVAVREAAVPGDTEIPECGLILRCTQTEETVNEKTAFTAAPQGKVCIRSRRAGDVIALPGGSKTLKKWMIDQKIPASRRENIPVLEDEAGILGIYGLGRTGRESGPVQFTFLKDTKER